MMPVFSLYVSLRRCVQVLTGLVFCLLPWLNALGVQWISGSLFALDLKGVPFADPVAVLQVAAGGFAPAGRLLAGAALSLSLALSLGRVFCSWICPYGLFSELIYGLRRRAAGTRAESGPVWRDRAFLLKAGNVLLGLAGAVALGFPLLSQISMPGELSLAPLVVWQEAGRATAAALPILLFGILALPGALLAVEAFSGKRFWCRYICPQSVLLGLAARCLPARLPGLRVRWRAIDCTCKEEKPCRAACSLALNPRQLDGPSRRDCTMCGDCLKACAGRGGALRWQWRAAVRHKPGGGGIGS